MDKTLLIGPPGSGKTHSVLEKIVTAIRKGRSDEVMLVVPTVSMATHVLHTLARQNRAVSKNIVRTLDEFVAWLTPKDRIPSAALRASLVEEIIREVDDTTSLFQNEITGRATVMEHMMSEFWAAGCDTSKVKPFVISQNQKIFLEVFQRYENRLSDLGYMSPWQRFQSAIASIEDGRLGTINEIYFDGFFFLTANQQQLIQAAVNAVKKSIIALLTEPDESFRNKDDTLLPINHLIKIQRPSCKAEICQAVTPTHEIEEIARRIISTINPVEPSFKDYGIVLFNSEKIYEPIICRVFERFGIPFHSRQKKPLAAHHNIRFVIALLRAAERGFPSEETLGALCSPYCNAGNPSELDAFDFEIRRNLPGNGLDFLEKYAAPYPTVSRNLTRLHEIADWPQDILPLTNWVGRVCNFQRDWSREHKIDDVSLKPDGYSQILNWRSITQATSKFRQSAEETEEILSSFGRNKVSFSLYIKTLEFTLKHISTTAADNRRNVVRVLPVHEARQWELPVVFVPGLVDNRFSSTKRGLFFNEVDRTNLRKKGIPLRSATDEDAKEALLFNIARTRSRKALFLSYPQFNELYEPQLRSLLIKESEYKATRILRPVKLRESVPDYREPSPSSISSTVLRGWINNKHKRFSPTSIESFLQCPYQYFARHTLALEERPHAPEKRLDRRLEGIIVHRTLTQWSKNRLKSIQDILGEIFESECHQNNIPHTVHTLATRYRIENDLTRFCGEEDYIVESATKFHESNFQYVVDEHAGDIIHIWGRIDCYAIINQKYAFVVDYKYSFESSIKDLVDDEESHVQGPLYLLGLEQKLGLQPIGLQFWGLRGKVTRRGRFVQKHLQETVIRSNEIQDDAHKKNKILSEEAFREFLDRGLQRTLNSIEKIRSGYLKVDPNKTSKCQYCSFRNLCRIRNSE